jgi:hypothetical protein
MLVDYASPRLRAELGSRMIGCVRQSASSGVSMELRMLTKSGTDKLYNVLRHLGR